MKNFIEFKTKQYSLDSEQTLENKKASNKEFTRSDASIDLIQEDASLDEICMDNYNMKSSEEETIFAPVIHSNSNYARGMLGKTGINTKQQIDQNNSSTYSESFVANRSNGNLHTNQTDHFKASKYFSYIMAKENDLDTFSCRNRSMRKSISKKFKVNHLKLNKKIAKSNDSICSTQYFAPISRSAIASNQLEQLNLSADLSISSASGNDSIKSFSLPNAFRSNFILRKNNDIYYSQTHLHSVDSLVNAD